MNSRRTALNLACACLLFACPVLAQQPSSKKAAGGTLTIDPTEMQKPWTGDLDGMVERRLIRVLTVNSKTYFSSDKGTQRGIVVDPNVWFQNVEYVVAEKIGQETVTYMSNIYKYYIAYRLIMESREAQKDAIEKVKAGAR